MLVVPLVPLVQSPGAWPALPRPACWLTRTIRLGYAIQFARRPPNFRGIRFITVLEPGYSRLASGLVCSGRPEGCVLSCFEPPSTQAVSPLRVRGESISLPGTPPLSTSADWAFRSTEKRVNSPLCRGSLSAWSWTRSTSQRISH